MGVSLPLYASRCWEKACSPLRLRLRALRHIRRIFPPPPSDNILISGGLVQFLEPLCTHVILRDCLVFCFMSDIIEPCISRSFPIALRRQRSCCASRFVTVTRSASAPWPTCPIGSPRAWRPCVGLSGANWLISEVETLSVGRSLV